MYPESTPEWQVGDVILDLYEVKSVLGEGGMGKVYRVHHKNWNIDLAVKTPRFAILAKAGAKEDFVREAETWVNLGLHPHTVSCYYVREIDGLPRVFAECVEGGSLADWIHNGKLYDGGNKAALERILDVAIQFAWGLNYAHEQGLVHQDVKPMNVMMTPEGIVKVTDFGLAQARALAGGESDQEYDQTKSTVVPGAGLLTRAYASPEQFAGQPLSRKTDIWSWAVSVLEMFTGGTFWQEGRYVSDSLDDYLDNWVEEDYLPDQQKVEIPEAVAGLFQRCFQDESIDRPRDMVEVADHLQEVYHQVTGTAYSRRVPKAADAIADSLNNRALSLLDLRKKQEALELWNEALKLDPRHATSLFNRGLILWRDAIIDDQELLSSLDDKVSQEGWLINYLLALTHTERGDCLAATEKLDKIKSDETPPEVLKLRADVQKLLPLSTRLIKSYELPAKDIIAISSCGQGWYALSRSKLKFRVWEVITGKLIGDFSMESRTDTGWLSPGGRYIMKGSECHWNIATGERCSRINLDKIEDIKDSSLSPDDRYIADAAGLYDASGEIIEPQGWRLRIREVKTGRCWFTIRVARRISATFWDGDKGCVLTAGEDRMVKIWAVNSAYHYRSPFVISRVIESAAAIENETEFNLHLDSAKLAFQAHQFTATAEQLRAARAIRNYHSHPEAFELWTQLYRKLPRRNLVGTWKRTLVEKSSYCSVFTPDARYLLQAEDGSISIRNAQTGEEINSIQTQHHQDCYNLVVSKDSRFLGTTNGTANESSFKFWELQTGRCVQTIVQTNIEQGYNDELVSISADNRHILTCPTLKLWDIGTGLCLRTFERVHTAVLSSDTQYALSVGENRVLKLWQLQTGRCVREFEGHTRHVQSVALSPDGLLALSSSFNGSKVWDVQTGECLLTYLSVSKKIFISPSGQYALLDGGELWHIRTGKHLQTFEGDLLGVSDDWARVFSRTLGKEVKVWHLDWELDQEETGNWDEGARPYLQTFITLQTPYAGHLPESREPTEEEIGRALTRKGQPEWSGDDFQELLLALGCAGYGWLRPEGVRRELEKMAAKWNGPLT